MGTAASPLDALVDDFVRSLRARNLSPKTIKGYGEAARLFASYAADNGLPVEPAKVRKVDVEAFVTDQLERWTPSTAATRFRYLQQFWKWLAEEGEIPVSPMARMSPPKIDERPVPILTDDEMRRLIKGCAGTRFDDRRDVTLVRLFASTGIRLGEMAGVTIDALDRDTQRVLVIGKGDRGRWAPYGPKTAVALDRYLRDRRRHPRADLPWLWLGVRGRLTDSGIAQVLERRAVAVGIDGMHAHRFRHTYAHRWLAAGGTEGDLQELAGWKSPQMLARYGASARAERAAAAYQRLDLEGGL
jgi:site-specific recombinase XerD